MRSVTNGLAEGLSFNLPKSWARIPERTELCNEENQAIAATLIARFQNPASHRFVFYWAAPTAADPESGAPLGIPCEVLKARGSSV